MTVSPEAGAPEGRPTVVMVHGLGMSARSLLPTARLLARDFRVVLPELPGNGRSTRPADVLDVPALADALVDWMDRVGLPSAVLVGHSLGSQVAVHAAGRHPDRVTALVLVSPSRDPLINTPWKKALRLLLDGPRESPKLLPVAVVDYLRAGPIRMWRTLRASLETDPIRTLGRVRQPTLVVRGDRDLLVSPWWARTICAVVGDGRVATVTDGPHGLPFSTPADLTRAIMPFLRDYPGLLS
ncbi:alpha/beta fold hydrolase [Nakamurella flava]|uniref:alpha/beta fold hydrolase n=1 Tax=Nakamurella flava TaxID=2576308 RepID=UPI00140AF350|nr:alpha/beta hydrolase [Nakamurella flava]